MVKKRISLKDETRIMEKIAVELEKLPQESQKRVVDWLVSIVGISTQKVNNFQNSQTSLPSQVNVFKPAHLKQEGGVKDFFYSKQPGNNCQKLAVLGYYLEFMKGKDEFNTQDLKIVWKLTREALPSSQVFSKALNNTMSSRKYFVSGQKKGWYRIGIKGQNLVEALPKKAIRK